MTCPIGSRFATFHSSTVSRTESVRKGSNKVVSSAIVAPDSTLPFVEFRYADGNIQRHAFSPTPKANHDRLRKALEELLDRDSPSAAQHFRSNQWIIDPRGDAIHRHLSFATQDQAKLFRNELMKIADAMNHHPHVTGHDHITVTSTTHNPQGLCMRDIKLARAIDELAMGFEDCEIQIMNSSELHSLRRKHRQVAREEIEKALAEQAGSCFTDSRRP